MPAESPLRNGSTPALQLIETLRWEPGAGFVRLDRHLARLYASAHALGFAADPDAIGAVLREAKGERVPLRVRLTLDREGTAKAVTQPFEPLGADVVWTLRIAATRLDAGDPLLRHKTSRRDAYEAARAEFDRADGDEVLLLNQRGELCEGTITNVFADFGDGMLLTPALASGLLPGVLRGALIDEGKAREEVLKPSDLAAANALHVGNSLRGLVPARLLP